MVRSTNGIDRIKKIKKLYQEFYDELHSKGEKSIRSTTKGIWGHFPCEIYYNFFKKFELQRHKNFLDLGSGDGKVTIIASLFTKASGIEFDKELYKKSIEIKKKLNIDSSKCNFINGDFLNADISNFDIIFINPDKGFHEKIEEKLLKEMKDTLVVINDIFLPRFLTQKKRFWIRQIPFTTYTNPEIESKY